MAHAVDDPGVWQNQAYQANMEKVRRQLIDDPDLAVCRNRQARQIGLANSSPAIAIKGGNAFGIRERTAAAIRNALWTAISRSTSSPAA